MNESSFSPPISDAANSVIRSKVKKQKLILRSLYHDNREEDDSGGGGGGGGGVIIPRKQCLLVSPDETLEGLRRKSGIYFNDGFVPSNGAYCFQYYDSDEEDMVEIPINFEGYFMVEDYQKKKLTIVPSRGPKKRPREEEEELVEEDREYHKKMDKKAEKEYPIVSPSSVVCRQREEDEESKQTDRKESTTTHDRAVMLPQSTTVASFSGNRNISYEEISPLTPANSTATSTGTKPKEDYDETSSTEEEEKAAAATTVVERACSGSISSPTNKDSSPRKASSSFSSSSLSDGIKGSASAFTTTTECDEGLLPSDHDQPNMTEERPSTTLSPLKKLTLFPTTPATIATAVETKEEGKDKDKDRAEANKERQPFSCGNSCRRQKVGKSAVLRSINTTTAHKRKRKRRAILEDSELEDYAEDNEDINDLKETPTTTSINSVRLPKKKKKRNKVYLADKKRDKSAPLADSDTTRGSKINAADNASDESYSSNLGKRENICLQDDMRRGGSRSTNNCATPRNNDPLSRSVIEAANCTTTTTTSNDYGLFPGRGRKEKQKNPVGNPSLPSPSKFIRTNRIGKLCTIKQRNISENTTTTNSSIPADALVMMESNDLALEEGNNGECSVSSSALVSPPSLSSTCEDDLSTVVEEGQKEEEKGSSSNNTATAQITDNSGEPTWEGINLDSTGKTDGNEDKGEDYNVDFDVCSISLVDRFSSDINSELCPMVGKCGHSFCKQSLENWFCSRKGDRKHARKNYINCIFGCKMQKKDELGQYKEVENSSFDPKKLVPNYSLCQAVGAIYQVKQELSLLLETTSSVTTTTTHKEKQRKEIIRKADDSFTKCCYITANGTKCHSVFSTKAKTNLDKFHHTRAPIVGLCGHTFCLECIYEIHACFLQQSQGSNKRKWFPCPTCQQVKVFHSEQLTENIDFRAALRYWNALVRGDIERHGDERVEEENRQPQLSEPTAKTSPTTIKTDPCAFRKPQGPAKPPSTYIQREVLELENGDDIKDTEGKDMADSAVFKPAAVKREEAMEEEEDCSREDAASMVCNSESASLALATEVVFSGLPSKKPPGTEASLSSIIHNSCAPEVPVDTGHLSLDAKQGAVPSSNPNSSIKISLRNFHAGLPTSAFAEDKSIILAALCDGGSAGGAMPSLVSAEMNMSVAETINKDIDLDEDKPATREIEVMESMDSEVSCGKVEAEEARPETCVSATAYKDGEEATEPCASLGTSLSRETGASQKTQEWNQEQELSNANKAIAAKDPAVCPDSILSSFSTGSIIDGAVSSVEASCCKTVDTFPTETNLATALSNQGLDSSYEKPPRRQEMTEGRSKMLSHGKPMDKGGSSSPSYAVVSSSSVLTCRNEKEALSKICGVPAPTTFIREEDATEAFAIPPPAAAAGQWESELVRSQSIKMQTNVELAASMSSEEGAASSLLNDCGGKKGRAPLIVATATTNKKQPWDDKPEEMIEGENSTTPSCAAVLPSSKEADNAPSESFSAPPLIPSRKEECQEELLISFSSCPRIQNEAPTHPHEDHGAVAGSDKEECSPKNGTNDSNGATKINVDEEEVMESTRKKRYRGHRKKRNRKKRDPLQTTTEHPAKDAPRCVTKPFCLRKYENRYLLENKTLLSKRDPKIEIQRPCVGDQHVFDGTKIRPGYPLPRHLEYSQGNSLHFPSGIENDLAYLTLDPRFNPNAPLYPEQPFANVDVWPMQSPHLAYPVFVLRWRGKTRYHRTKQLGWEYVGNYKLASKHNVSRKASDCGHCSQLALANGLLKCHNGAKLVYWRYRLAKALQEDQVTRPENEEGEQLSLAVRVKALGFHEGIDDSGLARIVVQLDEYHTGLYTIQFVEYDARVYDYCSKTTTKYAAKVWYDHAENVMKETESATGNTKDLSPPVNGVAAAATSLNDCNGHLGNDCTNGLSKQEKPGLGAPVIAEGTSLGSMSTPSGTEPTEMEKTAAAAAASVNAEASLAVATATANSLEGLVMDDDKATGKQIMEGQNCTRTSVSPSGNGHIIPSHDCQDTISPRFATKPFCLRKYENRYLLGLKALLSNSQETMEIQCPRVGDPLIFNGTNMQTNYPLPRHLANYSRDIHRDHLFGLLKDLAYMTLDPRFNPNAPLYPEQPFANVDVWPFPTSLPDLSCPVFVLRKEGKTRYHNGKLLGWEYVGNYKLALEHSIGRKASDCGDRSQKALAEGLVTCNKGAKLVYWRYRLVKAIQEDHLSPSKNQEGDQLPLAARVRALGFHKDIDDLELARIVVQLDEYHAGQYTIEFVEYDQRVYEFCSKRFYTRLADPRYSKYTAKYWYDHAENKMLK